MRIHSSKTAPSFFLLLGSASLLFGATPSRAEPVSHPESWGLGLMLGSPLGINVKHWLGGANAFDLAVGGGPGLRFHGDYEWGLAQVLRNKSDLTLDLYLGLGGVVGVGNGLCGYYPDRFCSSDVYGGARVPFGLDFKLTREPVNFGLELAPGILFGNGGVGGLFDVFLFVRYVL
jgi:hypothetical protein